MFSTFLRICYIVSDLQCSPPELKGELAVWYGSHKVELFLFLYLQAGYEDPLSKYQQYSLGFKHFLRNNSSGLLDPASLGMEDTNIVLNAVHIPDPTAKMERHDSGKIRNIRQAATYEILEAYP
jgi:hypothetical protein